MRTEDRKNILYGILPGKLVSPPPRNSLVGEANNAHFALFPGETSS